MSIIQTQGFNDKLALKMVELIQDEIYPSVKREILSDIEINWLVDLFSECLKVDQNTKMQILRDSKE